jgi:hypothetical protein
LDAAPPSGNRAVYGALLSLASTSNQVAVLQSCNRVVHSAFLWGRTLQLPRFMGGPTCCSG